METERKELSIKDLALVQQGYDPDQVHVFLQQILSRSAEEINAAVEAARNEERAKVYAEISSQTDIQNTARRFDDWVRQLSCSMDKLAENARQKDEALRRYHMREKELQETEVQAKKNAERIITEARAIAQNMQAQAQATARQTLRTAQDKAEKISRQNAEAHAAAQHDAELLLADARERARQQAEELLADARRQCTELLEDARKERIAIVERSTQDVRRIREDSQKTMTKVQMLLEELERRSMVAEDGKEQHNE